MKSVSATEAKNRFGSLLADLNKGTSAIVVENHGRPRAVIISPEEWDTLLDARERLRQREAWERIKEIAEEVSARNADLSQEEADALADEIADEAMARVVARARLRWAERSS
jgi:prevent-host-death family protein